MKKEESAILGEVGESIQCIKRSSTCLWVRGVKVMREKELEGWKGLFLEKDKQ